MQRISDGLSNTLLIGEKHVTPLGIGIFDATTGAEQDFCVYSSQPSKWAYVTGRKAGVSFPLALNGNAPYANQFGSWHPAIVHFTFGDATVRGLRNSIAGSTLALLSARDDGQPVPALD
jgi:hypothetical protein